MSSLHSVPLHISGYTILPLSLPSLPSFPIIATHYIYLAPHQPRIPTATAQRSLFLVNIPFDSTESHIKHLLSLQLDLPNGRIEDVQLEGRRRKGTNSGKLAIIEKKGKKRKRSVEGDSIEDIEGAALPSTWDRELQSNGRTAVVVFVDRPSMDACLKAVKKLRKEQRVPVWGEAMEERLPSLGSTSANSVYKPAYQANLLMLNRIFKPPQASIS